MTLPRSRPDRIVTASMFGMSRTRSGAVAFGTVLILSAMTVSLGIVAVLGNLAIAAFLVGERRRVIGIRRALGATRPDILGYLLLETLIPTQIGNVLGFVALVAMFPVAQKRFSGLPRSSCWSPGTPKNRDAASPHTVVIVSKS